MSRVETGVPGLDTILNGGLFKGGVDIVEGPPGAGKTILGNQITDRGVVVADTFDSAEQILTGAARTVAEPEPAR
jgi:KaiC/GvpD/RAD55 family RecA-like ATPase